MFDLVSLLALALAAAPNDPPTPAVAMTGRMALKSYTITLVGTVPANGDNDGFADADETVDLAVTLINRTGVDLDGVVAILSTSDPTVECVSTSQVVIGAAAAGATVTAPPFRFKVGDASVVNRANIDQVIQATFDVAVRATQFEALTNPITFTLPLDLSATGGSGPSPYVEDFEIGGSNFGKFTLQSLDAGKNSLALSDGMRCQYNDPDAPNTLSPDNLDCYLGYPDDPPGGLNYWHVHAVNAGGYGRAYTGTKSLHWGVHLTSTPARDTTPWKQLDAVKSFTPINVPLSGALPELAFAHQVSMADERMVPSLDFNGVVDRAIVQVNVLNSLGLETTWRTINPYVNEYDSVPRGYSNCTFDPTDDGNNEDSYFDPSDPDRHLGPSSTCDPRSVFGRQGDTDYRFAASATNIGRAYDGPGLAGSIDVGTWVRPRFNLQEFAGRKIRLRFLATSIEVGSVDRTWDDFWNRDDLAGDDGWYVDDVRVNAALGVALTLAADTKTITSPMPCGACTTITAALTATPDSTSAPGQPVLLDAGGSSVDVCLDGPLQFQFWIDGNDNGIAGDAGDTLIRDFGPPWTFTDTPENSARIAVLARCLSAPLCDAADGSDTATALVTVNCPSGVTRTPFAQTIRVDRPVVNFERRTEISWPVADSVDALRGMLSGVAVAPATDTLQGGGSFTGTVTACLTSNSAPTNSILMPGDWTSDPTAGSAFYYLVRGQASQTCAGTPAGYTTNAAAEHVGRDAQIDADPVAAACP